MQVEYHADTDTHTCTHTYMHAQPDGAVCRACPIKVHPLVKKMYGCNALPQAHKNTNTYTDTQLQGCMYTLIAKQHNSQSFSHTHAHTHLISIVLFIFLHSRCSGCKCRGKQYHHQRISFDFIFTTLFSLLASFFPLFTSLPSCFSPPTFLPVFSQSLCKHSLVITYCS